MFPVRLRRIDHLLQIRPSLNHLLKYSCAKKADLLGIEEVSSKDVAGTYEMKIQPEEFDKKYSFVSNRKRTDNEEKILSFPHGSIRFDKDNQPQYHGQFDEDNPKLKYDLNSIEHLIDNNKDDSIVKNEDTLKDKESTSDQIKNSIKSETNSASQLRNSTVTVFNREKESNNSHQSSQFTGQKPFRQKIDISNVDIYDFEPVKKDYLTTKLKFNVNPFNNQTEFKFAKEWSDWINRDVNELQNSPLAMILNQQRLVLNSSQIFKYRYEDAQAGNLKTEEEEENLYSPLKSIEEISEELNELKEDEGEGVEITGMNLEQIFKDDPLKRKKKSREDKETEDKYITEEFKESIEEKEIDEIDVKKVTSLDYLRKIKDKEVAIGNKALNNILNTKSDEKKPIECIQSEVEYDSKGFKNYKNHVFNLYKLNVLDRALFLESETIFNGLGIVAVNKPYGLICLKDNDNSKKNGVQFDTFIRDFTQLIAMKDREQRQENTFDDLNNPILYPIYKLDKNCTGVYILAKNKKVAKHLHDLFSNRNVSTYYQAITKNVPKLEKATIDIPIEMDYNDLKYKRMVLKPVVPDEFKMFIKPSKSADKAITTYKVLSSNNSAAHLELNPKTSVRHQLRVHLGSALRTPILGDHIYDNPNKIGYQKLPLQMLIKLNVRATKTMHIPLHLHCKMVILNEFRPDGRDFFLKCDPPHFFKESLKNLKLN